MKSNYIVNLHGTGYEWTCPDCNREYYEPCIIEKAVCPYCNLTFETNRSLKEASTQCI